MGSKEAPSQNEAQAKRIAELKQILEGVPEGAFEGGWTAKGIMKHAADLERENKTLRQLKTLERMNDDKHDAAAAYAATTHTYDAFCAHITLQDSADQNLFVMRGPYQSRRKTAMRTLIGDAIVARIAARYMTVAEIAEAIGRSEPYTKNVVRRLIIDGHASKDGLCVYATQHQHKNYFGQQPKKMGRPIKSATHTPITIALFNL